MDDVTNQQILDKIIGLDTKFTALDTKFTGKFTGLDNRVTGLDKRVGGLEKLTLDIREEQLRQSVLMEDLDDKFTQVAESISENLNVKSRVDGHQARITDLEANSKLTRSVVTLHSRQLKALESNSKTS